MPIDSLSRSNESTSYADDDDRQPTTVRERRAAPRDVDPHTVITSKDHDDWLGAYARSSLLAKAAPADGSNQSPHAAAIASTAQSTPTTTPAQARLDAYRAAFSGPYRVDGQSVSAPPQFRMASGFNDAAAGYHRDPHGGGGMINAHAPQVKELYAICARAGAPQPYRSLMGSPTSAELVQVTQALIDAGKLPPGPGDLATRIKAMQWQHGIGIDCTDYVIGAAMQATGKTWSQVRIEEEGRSLPLPGFDYFKTAGTNPHLSRVSQTTAKTGDVFCLKAADPREPGHRAVVYSHDTIDATKEAALAKQFGSRATAFAAGGPVHRYEVDSSWGAGAFGASYGGVRRDTWLFNESTKQWAQINARVGTSQPPSFEVTTGPAGESLQGLYRFR